MDFWIGPDKSLSTEYHASSTVEFSTLDGYAKVEERGGNYAEFLQENVTSLMEEILSKIGLKINICFYQLSDNNKTVSKLHLFTWEKHDDPEWPSFASSVSGGLKREHTFITHNKAKIIPPFPFKQPHFNSDNWETLFHPLFGTCFVFKLGEVAPRLGEAGPSSVQIYLDFEEAFKVLSSDPRDSGDYDDGVGGAAPGKKFSFFKGMCCFIQ